MWNNAYKNLRFLTIEKWAFKGLGIDIEAPEESMILKRRPWLMLLLGTTIYWGVAFGRYAAQYRQDIDKVAEGLTLFVPCCIGVSKTLIFLAKARRFVRLIRDLQNLAVQSSATERQQWTAQNRRSKLITTVYFVVVVITAVVAILLPLLLTLGHYLLTGRVVLMLPFPGIFPYDHEQFFFYVLTYILAILFVIFILCSYAGVECLFSWLVHNVSAHFRILYVKVQCIALNFKSPDFTISEQHHSIAKVVHYHSRTIALSQELNGVFCEIMFAEVVLSCFQFCFIIYQLSSGVMKPSNMPLIVMAAMTVANQLMIYCFGGEKIQNESEMFLEGLYLLLPWELLSPKIKRLLLLPLMRAQRTSTLTGYFFVSNRKLLVWVLKTAASFNALLLAVKDKHARLK